MYKSDHMITETKALEAFCKICASQPYVTIDTEFHREKTYYSQLCLIQIAYPGKGDETAVLVDSLSPDLDLAPLYDLFRNTDVVKVFHAARQDLEIFYVEGGVFPEPFFDTQVAAMVCGFGDQVGYETLVRRIAKESLDKSSRFTDWARRPLTDKQMAYAVADVTHLRGIYEYLDARLRETGRRAWVEEELAVLTSPATYDIDPDEAWRRIKTRNASGKFLAVVRELAKYREVTARERNVPRNRILKDDAILELASTRPGSIGDLSKSRLLLRDARKGQLAEDILDAIARGRDAPVADHPKVEHQAPRRQGNEGLIELLRVLLKAKAEQADVAQKLIATASDLEAIAADPTGDIAALGGWRKIVFGADAMRLCAGEIALSADGSGVRIVDLSEV